MKFFSRGRLVRPITPFWIPFGFQELPEALLVLVLHKAKCLRNICGAVVQLQDQRLGLEPDVVVREVQHLGGAADAELQLHLLDVKCPQEPRSSGGRGQISAGAARATRRHCRSHVRVSVQGRWLEYNSILIYAQINLRFAAVQLLPQTLFSVSISHSHPKRTEDLHHLAGIG